MTGKGQLLTGAILVLGCAALFLRPPGTDNATVITAMVGVVGVVAPLPVPTAKRPRPWTWVAVVLTGAAAFAVARRLILAPPMTATLSTITSSVVAAIAEEAFFRRFAYSHLERAGVLLAIGGTAALFAIVHLPAYGPLAIPVDFGAGLLFGWQRWAAGDWSAPAITHVLANLLQIW